MKIVWDEPKRLANIRKHGIDFAVAERGYTETDLAEVSDHPEWTETEFAEARPFPEAFPDLADSIRQHGMGVSPTKELVSIPLDVEVIHRFRSGGPGWQGRINDALRAAVGLPTER